MKPSEAISKFKYELSRRNYSRATVLNYTACLSQALRFAGEIVVEGASPGDRFESLAAAWVSRLQFRHGAPKTINLHIGALRAFSMFVLDHRIEEKQLPRLKEPKKLPEPLTKEELKLIFSMENNKKHLLLIQLAYYGGLRLSDIQFLAVRDLRFDRGLIHIKNGKGAKDRLVPFPDIIHEGMREIIQGKGGDAFVFTSQQTGQQYPKRTIERIFENACRRAGVQGKTNIHRLRHSFGTHMVQNGVNLRIIQEAMGHASSKTTEIYTRVGSVDIAAVRNVLSMEN